MSGSRRHPFEVVIAGGGVAGLEAALALRVLAGDRITITMLAPEAEFVYRPLRVGEPFAETSAPRYDLRDIAQDIGFELRQDGVRSLDGRQQIVHTTGGQEVGYDALLLALGARRHARFKHALTLDDRRLADQLRGIVQDVEAGYARELAFLTPRRMAWPLPLYELALMTARRAQETGQDVSLTLVTPEDRPLEVFGNAASAAVRRRLENRGVRVISSADCETPALGVVALHPHGHSLHADRVIALPELVGPAIPGVPRRDAHGFVPIDSYCRVLGLPAVFAAGDATSFPVKHGGVAAQQAETAALGIAALAGAPVHPERLHPVIQGVLIGGDGPLYLRARLTGPRGSASEASEEPLWSPPTKISARYLTPYLEARARLVAR